MVGELKVDYTINWNKERAIVSSIKHKNNHMCSVHVRVRWSLPEFDNKCSLISILLWHCIPQSGPL